MNIQRNKLQTKSTMKSANFLGAGIKKLVSIKLIIFLIILFGKDSYLFYGPNAYVPSKFLC